MRSMHIIGSRELGGAESFFLRLLPALAAIGEHEVVAVTRRDGEVAAQLCPSIAQHMVSLRNGWDLGSACAIRTLIRRHRPDIVQTYMGRATRLTRVPRDCGAIHVARLGAYYKIDGYYRHADAWIGNTRGICDYLVREGLAVSRVFHVGNFVDVPAPTPASTLNEFRRAYDIPEDARVILSLGRFVEKKGFRDLLTAFAQLPASCQSQPVFLVLAGDGPLRAALLRQADEMGLADRLRWVGWHTQPGPLFHLADVFVCPSLDEPLGNVILEAWAHGVPVVSTDTEGARELIQNEVNGLVTPTATPAMLSRRMADLLMAPPQERQLLVAAGRDEIEQRHSRDVVSQRYCDVYGQLLAGASAAG